MRQLALAALVALGALAATAPAHSVEPGELLSDPVLEARARAISAQLRCLVCQNQSIDDSQADLAHTLRMIVREHLRAGESDADVIEFVVARYGDFVLLKPPFKPETWLLWGAAPIVLIVGGLALFLTGRRRRGAGGESAGLSDDERTRLDALLGEGRAPPPTTP
jgi:cytochrome c-type biogenesis protein CcmH